jgi:hypothetical protein
MACDVIDDIVKILDAAKIDIQSNMEAGKINASGRTTNSLLVERYDEGVRLVSRGEKVAPFETTEKGRPAGKIPKGFFDIIYQWSIDKGIAMDDKERKKFSRAVAFSIKKRGTERNRSNRNDIYSPVVAAVKIKIKDIVATSIRESLK